ncbi:MAG TPA: hypothetical protein PK033_07955 [Acetivibrio sp.]|nr:hypothetical protein [Clostridium sp.]HOQ37326.1 hypothetical protein [Acetivibrio sp.]HQA57795.1 hypothetical protein [Acetivibrio sp.]
MKNCVVIEIINNENEKIVKQLDLNDWYEQEIVEIDDEKYRREHKIVNIKGIQYDQNGRVEVSWKTYYDSLGRLIKTEEYDENGNLIKSEEIG